MQPHFLKLGMVLLIMGIAGCVSTGPVIDRETHPELFAGHPYYGMEKTTHRPGDILPYAQGCMTAGDAVAVAASDPEQRETLFSALTEHGKCFTVRRPDGTPTPIPVRLEEWIAGHYSTDSKYTVSVWRGVDYEGDTVYLYVSDSGGKHEAAVET